jgi:hypothetical protein
MSTLKKIITCEHSTRNPPSLTLMCVCVLKLSCSSLFPISILIQLFRCLEVVNTFCLSMIIRTRPRLWRQHNIYVKENSFKSRIINNLKNILQTSFIDLMVSLISRTHLSFSFDRTVILYKNNGTP